MQLLSNKIPGGLTLSPEETRLANLLGVKPEITENPLTYHQLESLYSQLDRMSPCPSYNELIKKIFYALRERIEFDEIALVNAHLITVQESTC